MFYTYYPILPCIVRQVCMLMDAQNATIQQRIDYSGSAVCMLKMSWKGAQQCGTATERHATLFHYGEQYPTRIPSSLYPKCRNVVLLLLIDGTRDGTITPLFLDSCRRHSYTKNSIISTKSKAVSTDQKLKMRPSNDLFLLPVNDLPSYLVPHFL